LGMGGAAKENGAGTAAFLQSLPTPLWKVAFVKLLIVSVVAAAPIVLFVTLSYFCYRTGMYSLHDTPLFLDDQNVVVEPRGYISAWFIRCATVAVLATLSLLWWMAAIGVNRSDEIRAGAIGFLGIVAIWCGWGYLFYLADKHHWSTLESTLQVAASAAPGGPMVWHLETPGPTFDRSTPIISFISLAAVAACFLLRFGRSSQKTGRGDNVLSLPAEANAKRPHRTQLSAIAWKQVRETGPLAVFALAASAAMASVSYLFEDPVEKNFPLLFASIGAAMTFLVAVVAGIGLYLDDLKPGLEQFWRSRPTRFDLWFGIKYLGGLLILVTVLGIPIILSVASIVNLEGGDLLSRETVAEILFFGWLFVMAYSLAMTTYCLLRQPLYAAIASLLVLWLGAAMFGWAFADPGGLHVALAMTLSLAATIALGWLAVKNDWGWKR